MTLREFFDETPKAALAFSGGVDSAYLLYAAQQCGADVHPYYVKSAFQPQFELDDALRLVRQLGLELTILNMDILADKAIRANPENRCYFCKKCIFSQIADAAAEDGYSILLDGTNASDETSDRPGMRALVELEVRSPLRLCGLTKEKIRSLSKNAGLFTWDKPSYACLATRIPAGVALDVQTLAAVERAENGLMAMGFRNIRTRVRGHEIWLEVLPEQVLYAKENWNQITNCLQNVFSGMRIILKVRQNVT